ncbi:MAG: leucine-rich repeat domain-containing protein, partial [Pseudomonadota bacterium]
AARLAYEEAELLIAEWQAAGDERAELHLSEYSNPDLKALDRLPPKVSSLTALEQLDLRGAQISDLTPLKDIKRMRKLNLSDTKVSDIAPIAEMRAMAEWSKSHGGELLGALYFDYCPNLPDRYQAITKIFDNKERTLAALNQIREDAGLSSVEDWLAGVAEDDAPRPPALDELPEQGQQPIRFTEAPGQPIDLEIEDRGDPSDIDKTLEMALRSLVTPIAEAGANLYGEALGQDFSDYLSTLDAEPSNIRSTRLWLAGNKLRRALKTDELRQARAIMDEPPLPPEANQGLRAIVETHNAYLARDATGIALDAARPGPEERTKDQYALEAARPLIEHLQDEIATPRAQNLLASTLASSETASEDNTLDARQIERQAEALTEDFAIAIARQVMAGLYEAGALDALAAGDGLQTSNGSTRMRDWAIGGIVGGGSWEGTKALLGWIGANTELILTYMTSSHAPQTLIDVIRFAAYVARLLGL